MIELRTLGDCQIVIGDERLGPQSPHVFALALYLAIERGRPHPRDELLAMFSPGVPEANGAHNLRQALYKLRQLGVPVETTAAGTLIAAAHVQDDYATLLATHELPDPRAERLPGQFLPGYWPKISDEFARWLEGQRDAVNGALRRAYVARILDRRAVARWDEVERFARACLVVDPLNEEATLALAEALALSGAKAAGVRVLDKYLEEVGATDERLTVPASVLRKRISERVNAKSGRYSPLPLVGREAELRLLSRLTADAQAGHPRAVFISGEAGMGKTRLMREHVTSLQLSSARVLEGVCQPHDDRRPMSVVVDLVPQLLRCTGSLGADPHSLELLQRVHKVDYEADTPLVAAGSSPDQLASLITDALSDVIDAVAANRLLVIAIEDLHWADMLSRRVIANLASERKARCLLLIIASRDPASPFVAGETTTTLRLDGLPPQDSERLVKSLLPAESHGIVAAPIERIVARAGGNPFYLRSLCDFYLEHGDLEQTPPVLRDIIHQRLAGLSPGGRTVFTTCAVLGRLATLSRIERSLSMPAALLADALSELEERGLVMPRGDRIEVHHALLTTSLFETETLSRLSVIRRTVAGLLEDEADSSGEIALYWEAAEHWTASGDGDRAKAALRTCALHAANIGAANAALEAIARFETVASEADAVALCNAVRTKVLREPGSAVRLLENWNTSLREEHRPAFRRDFDLFTYEVSRQYRGDGEGHLADLLGIIKEPTASRTARVRAASMAMCVADDVDDAELAAQIITDIDLQPGDFWASDPDMVRLLLAYHTGFGRRDEAIRLARAIADWPDSLAVNGESIRSLCNAGLAAVLCGDSATSHRVLERAFQLCITHGLLAGEHLAASRRCWTARQVGDEPGRTEWAKRVEQTIPRVGFARVDTHCIYVLALNALDNRNGEHARVLITEIERRATFLSRSSHWANVTALKLRLAALTDAQPSSISDELEDVVSWSLRVAPRAPDDDSALGAYCGLAMVDPARARDYLTAYLSLRRPGAPVLAALLTDSSSRAT